MTNNNNYDEAIINCCLKNDLREQAIDNIMNDCVAAAEDQIYNQRQIKNFDEDIKEDINTTKLYMRLYNPKYKLSSRINALRNKLMKVHVNNHMQAEYMANLFNCTVIVNKVPNTHPHMCLAQIRRQYEFLVTLGMSPLKIFDIGAGCRSIKYGLTNVFNNQPVLSAADMMRFTKRKQAVAVEPFMSRFVCECPVQQCTHIELPEQKGPECVKPDILLSIDSSYYDGVLDFIEKYLKNYPEKAAYLAFHVFDLNVKEGDISICGNVEGHFSIHQDTVKMTVNGNPCAYTHKIHALNRLYLHSTVFQNGVYYAVEKSADFGNSKYLLVHAVYVGDKLAKEFPNLTDTLHLKSKQVSSEGVQAEEPPKQGPEVTKAKSTVEIITNYDTSLLQAGYYYKITNDKTTDIYRVMSGQIQAVTLINRDLETVNLAEAKFETVMSLTDLSKIVTKLLLKKGEITYTDVVNSYVSLTAGRPLDLNYVTAIIIQAAASAKKVCESAAQILNSDEVKQINMYKTEGFTVYKGYWQMFKTYFKQTCNVLWYRLLPLLTVLIITTGVAMSVVYAVMNYQHIINYMAAFFFHLPFVQATTLKEVATNPATIIIELILWYIAFKLIRRCYRLNSGVLPIRVIKTSCINQDNYAEVCQPLMDAEYEGHPVVEWKHQESANLSLKEFLSLRCDCTDKDGLVQLVPKIDGAEEPIIYHVCKATNYCAAKRQVTVVPKPDRDMLESFKSWFDLVFEREIKQLLDGCEPSVELWLNHLSRKKQSQVATIHKVFADFKGCSSDTIDLHFSLLDINTSTDYEMFVKSEKQLYSGGKAPKNRCICSPNAYCKYVMGPVTWALEHQFAHFRGYCGGASWSDLENDYKRWSDFGFATTIQLDGSGFDRTQHQELKDIVDQKIYKYIASKVQHVPRETFLRIALSKNRKVAITHRMKLDKQRVIRDGTFKQIGSVFSGSCDTTLMNTLRMACYNRFVCERLAGLRWGQYEVKSKGDDTVTVIQPNVKLSALMNAYQAAFVYGIKAENYVGLYHGLGQIAKYFKIGTIEDIDFCSTETMYCPSIDAYKIMRQVKRFVTTSVYSRKATHFNATQLAVYLRAFYESNLSWMKGIPIFRAFNQLFYRDLTGLVVKTKTGYARNYFNSDVLEVIDRDYYFETDHHYTIHDHISSVWPTEQDCMEYFARKYNWSASDVKSIEDAILNNDGEVIDCALLEQITH